MLTGQNGILTNAAKAKESTDSASDLEYLQLKATECLMDYYQGNDSVGEDEYVLKKLAEDKGSKITVHQAERTLEYNGKKYNIVDIIGNESEKTKIEDDNMKQITVSTVKDDDTESKKLLSTGKVRLVIEENDTSMKAAIPNGFYYVTGKPSTGLVISDRYGDDDNNSKGGNQFVWVPCSGDKGVIYEEKNGLAKTWKDNYSSKQWWYTNYQSGTDSNGNGIYSPIKGSWSDDGGKTSSVDTYGGFYIARYEAGVPSNAPFYANTNGAKYETSSKKNTDQYIPVSKKNTPSWNYISQTNSKTVSENMYGESKTIKSYLIDGTAWDTTIQWISNSTGRSLTEGCKDWGNYSDSAYTLKGLYAKHNYNNGWIPALVYKNGTYTKGSEYTEVATGVTVEGDSKRNSACNIYDMAGNMWEWTTETGKYDSKDANATNYAVRRGGSFNNGGSDYPVSYRHGDHTVSYSYDFGIGFRVVLYIQ